MKKSKLKSLLQVNHAGNTYSITATSHAQQRIEQRKIDTIQLTSCILSIGLEKIQSYSNTQNDILVKDEQNNFSVVFAVEGCKIVIITVIDKSNCFVKNHTIVL